LNLFIRINNMSDPTDITIDDIIQFLEQEKEMFGSFTVPQPQKEEETQDSTTVESTTESPKPDTESIERSPSPEPAPKQDPLCLEERLAACTTLDELRSLCETADELRTDLEGTNLVFGVGNPSADLMLIGEAPGEQEDNQGEPFVGAAGQLLNKILKAIEFEREDVYIANILKHRPPDNRNPNSEELARSLPYLLRQIDLIQPKLILCLGKVAGLTLLTLNKDTTLSSIRGKFHDFRGIELTVTYHPAALLRKEQWKRPTWEDVQMVRKKYDELWR
jgi:uracil-DNA glycosylase family 4